MLYWWDSLGNQNKQGNSPGIRMTPVNLRLIYCAAIRLVILSSSVLPLKFIQYNKDLRNWLFKSHLCLLAICTHFEIKEIINFGWSVMLWVLMIQNFQVYLNCTYNVLYTTIYLISPPTYSFLGFVFLFFFLFSYGFTSAPCTPLCHVKVEQPWDSSALFSWGCILLCH